MPSQSNIWVVECKNEDYPYFKPGDIVRCQKYNNGNIKYYDAIVTVQVDSYTYIMQKALSVFDTYTEVSYDDEGNLIKFEQSFNDTQYNKTEQLYNSNTNEYEPARTTDNDKVSSLDLGADDYITKPFSTNELLARIRTSLRHSNRVVTNDSVSEKPYAALGLKIDFMKRIITRNGEPIHLTPVEYKIVAYIAKNSGKVITYSSILKNVWGPNMDENDNKILRVNMANIRRKIEPNPAEPTYILTELGVGYRMLEDSSL